MKNHYETLWDLFDDLAEFYSNDHIEIPMITGGISREQTMKYTFNISHKTKKLHVQIYRMSSGRYEYNGYVL
jgi:hypothetical protein